MEKDLMVEEQGNYESEKVISYIQSHRSDFMPTEEEVDFIANKLKLNNKNEVRIDGFLAYILVTLSLNFFIGSFNIIFSMSMLPSITIFFMAVLTLINLFALISIIYKHKIGKYFMFIFYLIGFIFGLLTFRQELILTYIQSLLLIVYVIKSKRLEFTLVKSIKSK
jgi:hypothetical protein